MHHKKLFTLALLALGYYSSQAQNADLHIISTAGNSVKNSGNTLTYTIGEVIIPTYKAGVNSLTQGFNQPAKLVISSVKDIKATYTLNTYPNPSQDIVNIDIAGNLASALTMEMFDNKGAKVSPVIMQNSKNKIQFDMQSMPTGYYFVRLINPTDNTISTLKIAKIN